MHNLQSDLVNSGADEFATEDDVAEQDGEVAPGLGVLRLLVQHEAAERHQIRTQSIGRVIHGRGCCCC